MQWVETGTPVSALRRAVSASPSTGSSKLARRAFSDSGEEAPRLLHAEAHVGVDSEVDVRSERRAHRAHGLDLAGDRVQADLELEHGGAGGGDGALGDTGHDARHLGLLVALGGIDRVGVGDERRPRAHRPAEQAKQRLAGRLAGDIPQGQLHRGEGALRSPVCSGKP